jgi:MFS family permease
VVEGVAGINSAVIATFTMGFALLAALVLSLMAVRRRYPEGRRRVLKICALLFLILYFAIAIPMVISDMTTARVLQRQHSSQTDPDQRPTTQSASPAPDRDH